MIYMIKYTIHVFKPGSSIWAQISQSYFTYFLCCKRRIEVIKWIELDCANLFYSTKNNSKSPYTPLYKLLMPVWATWTFKGQLGQCQLIQIWGNHVIRFLLGNILANNSSSFNLSLYCIVCRNFMQLLTWIINNHDYWCCIVGCREAREVCCQVSKQPWSKQGKGYQGFW